MQLNIAGVEKYHRGKTLKESKEDSPPLFPGLLIYLIFKRYFPAGMFVYSLKLTNVQLLHFLSKPSRKN